MVSTWGARDIEEERKSKRSCQNQTRRRSSGYLAYPIGTRNESMKQVLTEIPLLTTFPKEIESKRCLPPRSNRPVNLCLDTPRWKKYFQWYISVGSPITESRNSNNRSPLSILLTTFVTTFLQNNPLPSFHPIPLDKTDPRKGRKKTSRGKKPTGIFPIFLRAVCS